VDALFHVDDLRDANIGRQAAAGVHVTEAVCGYVGSSAVRLEADRG